MASFIFNVAFLNCFWLHNSVASLYNSAEISSAYPSLVDLLYAMKQPAYQFMAKGSIEKANLQIETYQISLEICMKAICWNL